MIDPFTLAQTHPSLETHYPVQTHTMLEKTVPSRMAQALVLFHCESPFSWQRSEIHADRRKGQTLVSPPAEPGAYLYELFMLPANKASPSRAPKRSYILIFI